MSHPHRRHPRLPEPEPTEEPQRSPFSQVAGRFASWIAGMDRLPPDEGLFGDDDYAECAPSHPQPHPEPEPTAEPVAERMAEPAVSEPTRFPITRLGYDRTAVDARLAELDAELARMRAESRRSPMSITEELERIGEQTSSILVVAHDKAQETTRRAQEQADRCVADAAANAVAITAKAKERLRQLDSETDSVWRERERLLDDLRVVSLALSTLADDASARFPAAEAPAAQMPGAAVLDDEAAPSVPSAADEGQATVSFTVIEDAPDDVDHGARAPAPAPATAAAGDTGDTGSWLVGLRPEE